MAHVPVLTAALTTPWNPVAKRPHSVPRDLIQACVNALRGAYPNAQAMDLDCVALEAAILASRPAFEQALPKNGIVRKKIGARYRNLRKRAWP